jgi:hypothetical protein
VGSAAWALLALSSVSSNGSGKEINGGSLRNYRNASLAKMARRLAPLGLRQDRRARTGNAHSNLKIFPLHGPPLFPPRFLTHHSLLLAIARSYPPCALNRLLVQELLRWPLCHLTTARHASGWTKSDVPYTQTERLMTLHNEPATLAAARSDDQTVDPRVRVQVALSLPWFPKSCRLTDCSHRQKHRHSLRTSMPVRPRLSYA